MSRVDFFLNPNLNTWLGWCRTSSGSLVLTSSPKAKYSAYPSTDDIANVGSAFGSGPITRDATDSKTGFASNAWPRKTLNRQEGGITSQER